jgi:hypothetical protein
MKITEFNPLSQSTLLTEDEVRELLEIAVDLTQHKRSAHVPFLKIVLRIARLLKDGPSVAVSKTFLLLSAVKGLDREVYSLCIDAMLFAEGDVQAEYATYDEMIQSLLSTLEAYSH